jgi:D-alanine-D-alanine ligase
MNLKNKKIAVLMGGRSGEREVSLRSGKRVLDSLLSQGYKAIPLDSDPDLIDKLKSEKIDVVYIMLHGKYGEDGTIQGLLEMHSYPYTGSKILASALGMNKIASKRVWQAVGIPTPKYLHIDASNGLKSEIEKIRKSFPMPLVVKPVSEGSSLGVSIVKNEKELDDVIARTVKEFDDVFVEEFIKGQEVTVGILGKGKDVQALPILELAPKNEFYDFQAKYTAGMTDFILPARLSKPVYELTQRIALQAHKAVGAYGFSRVDIIVSPDHTPYVHEINTIPGMTDRSDLPAEAAHAGISFDDLVIRILESAF